MSLFDKLKTTKLKSLKYGDDSFGGGDSLEPIIQTPIRDDNPVGVQKTAKSTAEENQNRVSFLLDNTARGSRFLTNQRNLQLSNTRLEPTSDVNAKTRITQLMYYTKELTLSQIGRDPSLEGEHYTRFGVSPFMDEDFKYTNVVGKNNTSPGDASKNRLVTLQKKLQVGRNLSVATYNFKTNLKNNLNSLAKSLNSITGLFNLFGGNKLVNKINDKVNIVNKVSTPILTPTIDSYLGGPNSINGLGFTTIRRFDYTNDQDKIIALKEKTNLKASQGKIDSDLVNRPSGAAFKYNSDPNSEQFTPTLPKSSVATKFDALQKQQIKQHAYYGGANVKVYSQSTDYNYVVSLRNPQEKIVGNRTSPTFNYFGADKPTLSAFNRNDGDNMSVVFELIDPFTGYRLQRLIFSAYISQFRVNSDSTWTNISYIGRSEDFYIFNKYKRTANFNLQIPCFNIVELREKHRALGALESSLAGSYNKANKLGGILTKLYLGNYIRGEVGIINSLSYDIPNDSSWDLDDQLAHNINVSINFTIIHNNLPTYRGEGGFLGINGNIPNAANGFISNFAALNKTGASDVNDINNSKSKFIKLTHNKNTTLQLDKQLNTPAARIAEGQPAILTRQQQLNALKNQIFTDRINKSNQESQAILQQMLAKTKKSVQESQTVLQSKTKSKSVPK